ncbi:cro [Caudoviricetes sp.]|nr:cro [Caudoviricetes sp.]
MIILAMTYTEIEQFYGSQSKAAEAIGASRQRVHNYSKRDRVPLDAQLLWEIASGGKLKADLPAYFRLQAA